MKSRPQLDALSDKVRSGDTIHVHGIDRIAQNLRHLLERIEQATNSGVTLMFRKEIMHLQMTTVLCSAYSSK